MHIAFDAKRYFFNQTGLGNYSRTLIDSLGAYFPEHEYYLFSPKQPISFSQKTNQHLIFPQDWQKKVPSIWRSAWLGKTLKQYPLDIYHGLSQELPFDIQHFKGKKIVTVHDLLYLRYPQAYPFFDRKMHEAKLRFACKHADGIIAISEQTKQDIIHFCNTPQEKIKVIYQAANPYFSQVHFSEKEKEYLLKKYHLSFPFVLYVGSITYRKNVISFIKSFPLLPKDLHIVLVGKGDKLAEIQDFVRKNGFEKRLHIFSDVPTNDLPIFYQTAKAFVYPSLFEGFGLPILEAQHCGLPVIVGNNGCFPETGGQGALYVYQTNAEEIAENICKILNDSILSENLIKKGKENAASFFVEKQAKELMEYYKFVM